MPSPTRLAVIALAAAGLSACAPERVDVNVHDIFTGDAARYALQAQMSPSLLAQVGGFLPATWPADAPRLLANVTVAAQNKVDLASSNLDTSPYSGLRIHWASLNAYPVDGAPLAPRPTDVQLYLGPTSATSISDPAVLPLASGAFPDLSAFADAGVTIPVSNGRSFDDGGVTCGLECGADAGAPVDAGPPMTGLDGGGAQDAGASSGGTEPDGGTVQLLVLAADAQLNLSKFVFAGQPFSIFVVVHYAIDSEQSLELPSGSDDLQFDIQFELAR